VLSVKICGVAKAKKEPKKQAKLPDLHVGSMLSDFMVKRGLNKAEVARRSFMTPQALNGVLKRASVQLDTLIRLSLATEHDFLLDISARTMGSLRKGEAVADPQITYSRHSGRAPIRFVIEADPDDKQTLRQLTELLRDLKS
jgi:hypothetical protein